MASRRILPTLGRPLTASTTYNGGAVATRAAVAGGQVRQASVTTNRRGRQSITPMNRKLLRNQKSPKAEGEAPQKFAHDLPSPFEPYKQHPIRHYHRIAALHFECHGFGQPVKEMDKFCDFAMRAGYALGIPLSAPKGLKMTKSLWTVVRSPFVHKSSMENFERRHNRRVIYAFDAENQVVDRWLQFLRIHAWPDVKMRAEIFRRLPLNFGAQMLEASTANLRDVPEEGRQNDNTTVRGSQTDSEKIEELARGIIEEEVQRLEEEDADQASEATKIEEPVSNAEQADEASETEEPVSDAEGSSKP